MKKGNVNSEGGNRERTGFFGRLRESSAISKLVAVLSKRVNRIVGLNDSFIASKAWKFIPAVVLAASIGTTGQLWKNERETLSKDLFLELWVQTAHIESGIAQRIGSFEQSLMGVRGNFEASTYVTPQEFAEYVKSLKLDETHPEIKGMSVSYYVLPDELEGHVRSMKERGFSNYGGNLSAGSSEYAPVVMIGPEKPENKRVIWFDNFSDPVRRATMEKARDFDRAKMTGALPLAQNGLLESEKWIIMFLPIYGKGLPRQNLADRRQNVVWWVATSFFIKDFLNAAIGGHADDLNLQVYDSALPSPESLVFDTTDVQSDFEPTYKIAYDRKIEVLNAEWTIVARPKATMESRLKHERPSFVLTFWTATSVLLTFFFWVTIYGRWNLVAALEALKVSSMRLLASEKRHRALFQDSKVPMLLVDSVTGDVLDANDEAAKFYGYPVLKIRTLNISQINDSSYETVQERLSLVRNGLLSRFETNHKMSSWDLRAVEVSSSPIDLGDTEGILQIVTDISDRKTAIEKIVQMATHDELTGLPNRNLLADRLTSAFAHADRNGRSVALMFLDLDHFKDINDSIGHDVGDLLLKEVALRMRDVVRAEDTVARQGGDEFLVVLPDLADSSLASIVAEKLIAAISKPFEIEWHSLHVGASIGIASYPQDAQDVETLMKYGDTAMYRVKNSGRNSYRFFSQEMHHVSVEYQKIADALHWALDRHETSLDYQPIVEVATGKTIGMEALLRWKNSELWQVSPMKFVPIAEDKGLIVPIGEWVIRETCERIAEWKSLGIEVPRVAINLSARQFRLKNLVEDISAILRETSTDPSEIGLEITESMLIQNVEEAVETLEKLAKLGFEVSIDDFWTWYSSLSYLKRFPVKKLKIDRSFVNDIAHDPDDAVIVKSIVDLAHNLELKVVAEGVETDEQLEMLKAMGCDYVQGYFYGRPISASSMATRLIIEKPRSS